MANGNEEWVNERLNALRPDPGWQPDARDVLPKLWTRDASRTAQATWQRLPWAGASVAVVAALGAVTLLPAGREAAAYCWQCLSAATVTSVSPGTRPAPEFALKDASGNHLRLSALRGNVVLLNFWATWCPACGQEMPCFARLRDKYSGRGFTAVGVSVDEGGWAAVRPFLARHGVNFPVVLDQGGAVSAAYSVKSLPVTMLIDRAGNIASVHQGLTDTAALEQQVARLLAAR